MRLATCLAAILALLEMAPWVELAWRRSRSWIVDEVGFPAGSVPLKAGPGWQVGCVFAEPGPAYLVLGHELEENVLPGGVAFSVELEWIGMVEVGEGGHGQANLALPPGVPDGAFLHAQMAQKVGGEWRVSHVLRLTAP